MIPRQRYLAALAGKMPDRVPFVIWNNKLPGGDIDRQLLKLQACIVNKSTVYRLSTPDILKQAAPGNRFIVGVSENISNRGRNALIPLVQTIHNLGKNPITTS